MSIQFRAKLGEQDYQLVAETSEWTILALKQQFAGLSQVDAGQQKWIFKGRILTDSTTVGSAGITSGSCVIVMKSASAPAATTSNTANVAASASSSANTAVSAPFQGSPSIASSAPLMVSSGVYATPFFDRAMNILLNNDPAVVASAAGILQKVAGNIIQFPLEEKYRKLSKNNSAFSKKVGNIAGGPECMQGLGFQLQGDEWVLEPHAAAWDNLVACKQKLDRFQLRLAAYVPSSTQAQAASAPILASSVQPASVSSSQTDSTAPGMDLAAMQQFMQALQYAASMSAATPSFVSSSSSAMEPVSQDATESGSSDATNPAETDDKAT